MDLIDRLGESEKVDFNKISQTIDILIKLLIVIRKTHKPLEADIFDNKALAGVLNFVTVRNIAREADFDKIADKYEQSLLDAKRLLALFHLKENSIRDILATLKNYIDNYSNTFSRSVLFINLQTLSSKTQEEIEAFFLPILRNEMALYTKKTEKTEKNEKKTQNEKNLQQVVENSYSTVFNVITKFCFDREKQYSNLQKVFKESSFLIQTMVG